MSGGHHVEEDKTEGLKVLKVSDKSARVRTVQVNRPTPQEVNYLAATAKGLAITLKHFARNFFLPMKKADERVKSGAPDDQKWKNEIETVQYPEEKVTYPERFRGLHRLMLRDDGAVRCVACVGSGCQSPPHNARRGLSRRRAG